MAKRTAENTTVSGPIAGVPPNFKGVVDLRVKSSKFAPSKAGLPMITLVTEVINPKTVKCDFDNKDYEISGLEITYWLMLNERTKDGKASDNLQYLISELLPRLGLPAELDDENPLFHEEKNPSGIKFDGVCFQAMIGTENPVEQKKLPNGQYVPVIDPATNQPLTRGWKFTAQTRDILRAVAAPSDAPAF